MMLSLTRHVSSLLILLLILQSNVVLSLIPQISSFLSKNSCNARYLETNCWALELGGMTILVDPVLQAPLTFGVPLIYSGTKRWINGPQELERYASTADVVLISQGFDDHAHAPTLKKLFELNPDMPYVCPPSAISILSGCGIPNDKISVLRPGEKTTLKKRSDDNLDRVEVLATTGALLSPPWQAKENGYILKPSKSSSVSFPSVYFEPHCMFEPQELSNLSADYVISPIATQELIPLPSYPLVEGGAKTLELAKILKAKKIIPMANGDLIQTGLSAPLIRSKGSEQEFRQILEKSKLPIELVHVDPGVEIEIK